MASRRSRLVAGLLFGLMIGVLAPRLGAVAFHSGGGSGSEPVQLVATGKTDATGRASWNPYGRPFSFEVTRHDDIVTAADTSKQSGARATSGTATAVGYECTPSGSCREKTWTGALTAAATAGNTFHAEPSLSYARFNGWLRAEDGSACHFRVEWFSSDAPTSQIRPGHGVSANRTEARTELTMSRAATATAIAPCWGAYEGTELGTGSAHLTVVTGARTSSLQEPEKTHPPVVCDEYGTCRNLPLP